MWGRSDNDKSDAVVEKWDGKCGIEDGILQIEEKPYRRVSEPKYFLLLLLAVALLSYSFYLRYGKAGGTAWPGDSLLSALLGAYCFLFFLFNIYTDRIYAILPLTGHTKESIIPVDSIQEVSTEVVRTGKYYSVHRLTIKYTSGGATKKRTVRFSSKWNLRDAEELLSDRAEGDYGRPAAQEDSVRGIDVSLGLFREGFEILRRHRVFIPLIALSLVGTYASVLIMIDQLWFIELYISNLSFVPDSMATPLAAYSGIAGVFFMIAFVVSFCNVAIVRCAKEVMDGEQPSLLRATGEATKAMPAILLHSIIMGSIGFLLALVEREGSSVTKATVYLFGVSYGLLSFFALQAVVLDSKGPVSMYSKSAEIAKNRFGDVVKVSLGTYGLVYVVANIALGVMIIPIIIAVVFNSLGIESVTLAALYVFSVFAMPDGTYLVGGVLLSIPILLIPLASNLGAVLKTVLYTEAAESRQPEVLDKSVRRVDEYNS